MGVVLAKPRTLEARHFSTGGIETDVDISVQDIMHFTTVNQALQKAYDQLAKRKTGPTLQLAAPQFDDIQDARAELMKVRRELEQLDAGKLLRSPSRSHSLMKGHTMPTRKNSSRQWHAGDSASVRKRRDTIELKNPTKPPLQLHSSAGPPSPSRLKLAGRLKNLCNAASEDEYALDDSALIDSDEGTPPSSLTQMELVQAQRAKTCPTGLQSVRLLSVHTDQNASMRKHQEDMFYFADPFPTSRAREGLFAVFDGHGGRECVELVEKRLGHHVLAALHGSPLSRTVEGAKNAGDAMGVPVLDDVDRCIAKAFLATDRETKDMQRCGTTAAMIYIHRRGDATWIHVANVGDTRAVVCRAGNAATRITIDHTPKLKEEAQRVKECGGILLRKRVCGHLAVTRSFGDYGLKDSGVTAVPYQMRFPLTKEIQFIVIASDGLWDVLDDQAVTTFVLESGSTNEWKVSQLLTNRALELGSRDNITTMVLFF